MILRKLYESEYEEWNSEDDEEDGDWEWVWEDEEEENQGEQMQTKNILLWKKIVKRTVSQAIEILKL